MTWDIVFICALASVILLAWMRFSAWAERREEIRAKAQRAIKLEALRVVGIDKHRPMDIRV